MPQFVRRRPPPQPGVVVGIDQSYGGFGLVIMEQDFTTRHLHKGWDASHAGVLRLGEIMAWLRFVIRQLDVVEVAMEGYAPGTKFGREKMGELGAAVKLVLFDELRDPVGFPTIVATSAVKKFATGKGSGPKDQVTKDVYRKWGYDAPNNDVADAYVLARVAHALQWGPSDPLVYEAAVLKELTRHTERPR